MNKKGLATVETRKDKGMHMADFVQQQSTWTEAYSVVIR
jgi:hypothetical protein